MSSPHSSLKNKKRTPMNSGSRAAPFKQNQSEADLVAQILASDISKQKGSSSSVSNNELMKSMMTRLATVEKQLSVCEELNREKDKRIKVLEEKCEIYKRAQGYGSNQAVELERKCHKLQKQIHGMENFLEDYGMIWVGTNNSSEDEGEYTPIDDEEDLNVESLNVESLWKPDLSVSSHDDRRLFQMDYDVVLKNIQDLNDIAGEGQHFVKYTKDGARLEVQDAVPLTLYKNGIFMFGGPFRPFNEATTQICMQDLMDGYFPGELQNTYPDGVPFKVKDKRETIFRDKRLEKLFPGEGYSLSPEKPSHKNTPDAEQQQQQPQSPGNVETKNKNVRLLSAENFLSKLPPSVIRNGKIVDIRDGLRETIQDQSSKNNVIVVETDVVKDMKTRLSTGRKSRPTTPAGSVTTLRIKSENGDQTYVLKMLSTQKIEDVHRYLDKIRGSSDCDYDLKTSFPNQTYADLDRTLREYSLVPNATLHMVLRKDNVKS